MVVSRPMYDESEEKHPLREEEFIKVENIRGHIIFGGAEDDVLWDTCKYIRRMMKRLDAKEHSCTFEAVFVNNKIVLNAFCGIPKECFRIFP